jgi:hypothetical protein
MQTLSNVPFDEIRVGDRVKSMRTLREGFVSNKIPIHLATRCEDNEVFIKWEHGAISYTWLFQCEYIWLM